MAEGVPIREQIVARHGKTVITRNCYGALCLNTPEVMFVDIDFERQASGWLAAVVSLVTGGAVVFAAIALWRMPLAAALISGVAWAVVLRLAWAWTHHKLVLTRTTLEQRARQRVIDFLQKRPDWRVRLYRTPAGFRLLVMHRLFDPHDAAVEECFAALKADPMYAKMCHMQRCFRARVSPKPWRIGLEARILPYAAWDARYAGLPQRLAWIEHYERAAQGYCACRFVEELGQGNCADATEAVRLLHDDMCRVDESLPSA